MRRKSNDSAAVSVAAAAACGTREGRPSPDDAHECDHDKAGGVHLRPHRRHDGRRGKGPERGDDPAHCQLDVLAHRWQG